MNASEVLALAARLGVAVLLADGGQDLDVGPTRRVNRELRAGLKAHKPEILALLHTGRGPPPTMGGPAAKRTLPKPNTTPTPDILYDELAPTLNEGELRVLLYLIRRTYGFGKVEDRVSLSQFEEGIKLQDGRYLDHGTGMSRRGVIAALAALERRGLVQCERSAAGRGHSTSVYTLHIPEDHPKD